MKLTLVSVKVNGRYYSRFVNLPFVNGKSIAPHDLINEITYCLPRSVTITIG